MSSHQEPVDIHEQQGEEESVEEEVEGDVGDRLDAGHAGGVQNLERKPVETEPEPERREQTRVTSQSELQSVGRRQKMSHTASLC